MRGDTYGVDSWCTVTQLPRVWECETCEACFTPCSAQHSTRGSGLNALYVPLLLVALAPGLPCISGGALR